MRSKTSYFNPALFKKNLTRFWPLWGGASLIGALFPLAFLTILIREDVFLKELIGDPLEVTLGYYQVVAWIIPTLSLLYAALCALAAWGWLYNPRSVGMYHSLPITRKGLFVTSFLSGFSMMLLPYAVTGALAVLITAAVGGLEPVGLAVTILSVLGQSFFFYASATLVVFITGNPFAFAAFYFLFHFLAAGAEWLASRLMTMFYFGVHRAYEGVVEFLSPTLYLTKNLDIDAVYKQITTASGWIDNGDLESVTLVNGWLTGVYALVGAALLAAAWALYRRRRGESAGDVVAVGWMKPVFRYGVALCAAFAGGMLLYSLFFEGLQNTATAGAAPMAVCMAIAGVIGYYIASMLLSKSLRVFRGSWKGALGTVIAAAALCLAIAADPFGLESWIPQEGQVQAVRLYLSGWNGGGVSAWLEDPAAIRGVLSAHRAILSEREELDRDRFEGENHYLWLDVDYCEDAEGDHRVNRGYHIPCSPERMEKSEALRAVAAMASSPAIQEANIFSNVSGADVEARLTGGYIARLYTPETGQMDGDMDLTLEQARALEDAIRRDIQAGHFGKTLFLGDEDYDRAACMVDLDLYYSITSLTGRWTGSSTSGFTLNLSTYCTETLQALEDLGVVNESRQILTYAQRNAMDNLEKGIPYEGDYNPGSFPGTSVVYPSDAYVYPGEEVNAADLH